MYSIFTRLGDGEFLFVASRDKLEQAEQLARELKICWPHEFVVRDSKGNAVAPEIYFGKCQNSVVKLREDGNPQDGE